MRKYRNKGIVKAPPRLAAFAEESSNVGKRTGLIRARHKAAVQRKGRELHEKGEGVRSVELLGRRLEGGSHIGSSRRGGHAV